MPNLPKPPAEGNKNSVRNNNLFNIVLFYNYSNKSLLYSHNTQQLEMQNWVIKTIL